MSLDAEVRAVLIAEMMRMKFGRLLDWKQPQLSHDFGSNNLDIVEKFESHLSYVIEEVRSAFDQMSDEAIEEAGAQISDPNRFKASSWGNLLDDRIDKMRRAIPTAIAYGFGHPNFAAKFEHWARMPKLSLHEVSLVSLGAEPSSIKDDMYVELKKSLDRGIPVWAAHRAFLDQREIFRRCYQFTGFGYAAESIISIKRWIDDLEISVHPKFYEGLEARIGTKKIETPERTLLPKFMTSQERDTLLKLIAAMAVKGYAFDQSAQRNQATADIQSDLDQLGISLDQKTILKWVREACEIIPKG